MIVYSFDFTWKTVSLTYNRPNIVGRKAINSPHAMILAKTRIRLIRRNKAPRREVRQFVKILDFIMKD